MAKKFEATRCWVCNRIYPFEDLGRVQLPLVARTGRQRYMRVICRTCYQAVADSVPLESQHLVPVLHGF